jgi:hypothetical protein
LFFVVPIFLIVAFDAPPAFKRASRSALLLLTGGLGLVLLRAPLGLVLLRAWRVFKRKEGAAGTLAISPQVVAMLIVKQKLFHLK